MKRSKPIPTRRAAVDLARRMLDEQRPCWAALRDSGVPRKEIDAVIAAASRLYLQPVHAIQPAGCVLKEWRR